MQLASIQVFYNKSGAVKYARARHYTRQLNCEPQFEYHQQSLEYVQGNEMPKEDNPFIPKQIGHIGQKANDDLEKAQSSTILKRD